MWRLTAENTNSLAHRVASDTLVFSCRHCEHGEVVVTDMIEEAAGSCSECDARYELYVDEHGS